MENRKYEMLKDNGTDKLSSIFPGFAYSTYVVIKADVMPINKFKFIIKTIRTDDAKNTKEPSRVLLFNFMTPYLLPTNAARVSDMLIISNEHIAISLLKNSIIMVDDKKTYEAPVIFSLSSFLVT